MEKQHTINGVQGRYWAIKNKGVRAEHCHDAQKWISEARPVEGYGKGARLRVEIRHDDECRNGHNSFAIVGDIRGPKGEDIAGGCLHEDIAQVFPELAHLIKWHLSSTDGPMHYIGNTCHLAGDADHWGARKGQPVAFDEAVRFNGVPIAHKLTPKFAKFLRECAAPVFDFEVIRYDHRDHGKPNAYQYRPKFTFGGFAKHWHECPFDTEAEALDFLQALQTCNPEFIRIPTQFSEGKARELDAARRAAVWLDATDEQLSAPRAELEAALIARLPALLEQFKADIEAIGFQFVATGETI